jgi:hypothetical protein
MSYVEVSLHDVMMKVWTNMLFFSDACDLLIQGMLFISGNWNHVEPHTEMTNVIAGDNSVEKIPDSHIAVNMSHMSLCHSMPALRAFSWDTVRL